MWQDWVIGAGSWIFAIALIPSIIGKEKPVWVTSALTATVLSIYCIAFYTMGMILSAVSGGVTAICWWILFFQVVGAKK